MAKIYVDTTRLIDFYTAADDKIVQVEELQKHKSSLVLTDQTITEFRHGRHEAVEELYKNFKRAIDDDRPKTVAVIQRLAAFKELMSVYREKGKEILAFLKKMIDDESEDSVTQGILSLRYDVCYLKLSDDVILKAHKRKLLGNPPKTRDKIHDWR